MAVEEIGDVLNTYPHHPYQQAFAIPEMEQKLLAYVLNQIHSIYTVNAGRKELHRHHRFPSRSLEQRLHMEPLIRHGIIHILQENAEWVSHHIPEQVDLGNQSSHWFG